MIIKHDGVSPRIDSSAWVAPNAIVCGNVAVGNPAQVFPPSEHEQIWEVQKPLNFPLTVYGLERSEASMEKITRHLSEALGSHISDEPST